MVFDGWHNGYHLNKILNERMSSRHTQRLWGMVKKGVTSTLGPSVVYGCTMRMAVSALGLPTLVAVGGANIATPVIVSKLGGGFGLVSSLSLAARGLPIAVHCVIEYGLYGKIKEHLEGRTPDERRHMGLWVHPGSVGTQPPSRVSLVVEGVVMGSVCAAAAATATVLALSPYYGGQLLHKAVTAGHPLAAAKLGAAALKLTRVRLADSLQQGVVWFGTYEGMRAAMAHYDKKTAVAAAAVVLKKRRAARRPYTITGGGDVAAGAAQAEGSEAEASPVGSAARSARFARRPSPSTCASAARRIGSFGAPRAALATPRKLSYAGAC